ncbi:MAG: PfkB family carbohydrate kinase [Desulfobacterales bacterium]
MASSLSPAPRLERVVVAGSTTLDINLLGAVRLFKPGGVPCYAGLTYRRLGLAVGVVTRLAAADRGLLAPLAASGIDCFAKAGEATTVFINLPRPSGRIQRAPSLAEPLAPQEIVEAARGAQLLHLGPLHPRDIDPALYRQLGARAFPGLVALDLQGLVRRVEGGRVSGRASSHLAEALRPATIVKSDGEESETACRHLGLSPEGVLERFRVAEWVVTRGADGGMIYRACGAPVPYPGAPVQRVTDPTGAGDVFFAAYLTFRLRDGRDPREAACRAAGLAARQVASDFLELPDARRPFSSPLPDAAPADLT